MNTTWAVVKIRLEKNSEVKGSNPVQALIFSRPYFHYCSSSVHYCEDRFCIDFFTQKESNLEPTLEAGREVKGVEGLLLYGGSTELFS